MCGLLLSGSARALNASRSDGGPSWQALAVAPWKLPLVVIAIAVPIVAAFYLGGPGVGVAMGALVAVTIVVVAVRQAPRGPIGKVAADCEFCFLVFLGRPAEEPDVVQGIAAVVAAADRPAVETLVLSPARLGFFDRWASDLEGARRQAQQRLVVTVASLAKAGVVAEARVGDEDLVQAVEDQLGSFAATEVILVTGDADEDPSGEAAALELSSRLRPRFRHLRVSGRAAR
jgi:hypothetical protein